VDADHVRDLATAIIASGARHARAVAAAQAGHQLASQLASRLRVDGVVDGFVGHVALGLVGEDALQGTRDLLGRPAPIQQGQHDLPAHALHVELAWRARGLATPLAADLSRVRGVRQLAQRVALQLPADRRRRAPEHAGHSPHAQRLLTHARYRDAVLGLKLLVPGSFIHVHTLCDQVLIAVEMPVTRHPPHRSVRARFGHTAPTLGG